METAMAAIGLEQAPPPAVGEAPERVALLGSGDHLSRPEFERRYEAMPELKKAELIEGVVYVGSPVGYTVHGQPHALVTSWLGINSAATPGVEVGGDATLRL